MFLFGAKPGWGPCLKTNPLLNSRKLGTEEVTSVLCVFRLWLKKMVSIYFLRPLFFLVGWWRWSWSLCEHTGMLQPWTPLSGDTFCKFNQKKHISHQTTAPVLSQSPLFVPMTPSSYFNIILLVFISTGCCANTSFSATRKINEVDS